jgi:hypothetical protein
MSYILAKKKFKGLEDHLSYCDSLNYDERIARFHKYVEWYNKTEKKTLSELLLGLALTIVIQNDSNPRRNSLNLVCKTFARHITQELKVVMNTYYRGYEKWRIHMDEEEKEA